MRKILALSQIVAGMLLVQSALGADSFRYSYSLFDSEVPANWAATDTQYGDWENNGAPYGCTNWSPSTSSVGKGVTFTQSASDCKQDQKRWAQDYIKNNITDETSPSGAQYEEYRTVTGSDSRDAAGILENWMPFDPTYTSWVDTNVLYGCTTWSPNPAFYTSTTTFTQTSTCKTDQERLRQDREKENYTDEVRDVGPQVSEQQTLTGQPANRPYSVTLGSWENVGEVFGCTNWSPSVDTINKGQTFTQNATDCRLDQTRTRAESYQDHNTGIVVPVAKPDEARTLSNQASSRQSIGTLEDWMPTTPTYTAWVNTSALNNCKVWTPSPSTKNSSGVFTQIASDCTTDQTRTRQDREMEQNTSEIRDKGVPVVENQTLNNQVASRSYSVTLGAWSNSGAKYACSNWSPAPSTVTVGQSFTQTATDCKQDQTRTRAESYVDHKTGSIVAVSVPAEAQTLSNQTNTQTATGTKETWMATTPTYTAWVSTNAQYACSNWSPAASTKTVTGTFTQAATDCKTDQTRNRQDREQESTTLAYRDKGAPVAEAQTLSGQNATRSYTVNLGAWANSGAKYACSNWSPAPSTVTVGQSFTQTATDCKQDQTRTRAESYVDHKSGSTVAVSVPAEAQTLSNQTNTQTATGTKETWVATTPTYTAWVNSGSVTGCSNWSPATSTVNQGTTLTQTATDCKQSQTRSRQDRVQETTTKVIKNSGSPVTETQTITASSTRSATGTKISTECAYTAGTTYVSSYGTTGSYMFYWGGNYVGGGSATSVVSGGYTYSRSTYQGVSYPNAYIQEHSYSICRKQN